MTHLRNYRQWPTFISAFLFISIFSTRANTVDFDDAVHRLRNLMQEYLQLERDLLDVRKSTGAGETADCLYELGTYVDQIDTRIDFLETMAIIASSMVDKSDEQTVLNHLNDEARSFLKHIELNRKAVNGVAG